MAAGWYSGVIVAPLGAGGFGIGLYADNYGNVYGQIYYGTPRASASAGYTNDLDAYLTGASISASLGTQSVNYNLGTNGAALAMGAGTPGVGVTYGFGPYRPSDLPGWLGPLLPPPPGPGPNGLGDPGNPGGPFGSENPTPTGDPNNPGNTPPPGLPGAPPTPGDPLVLDLTGAGIDLSGLAGSTAYFDFTGSGFARHTGWIQPGDGLLVLNPPSGSTITSAELLGAESGNGFRDLAALDANSDGIIDASDAGFVNLRVWVDADVNGQGTSGELYTLADLGITSISLTVNQSGQVINGNTVVETATFTVNTANGPVVQTIAEVNFATSPMQTIYQPPEGFTYTAEARLLPQLVGYGTMPDLWIAMSLNLALLDDVQDLILDSGTLSGAEFDAAFQDIVGAWAGVSAIDPASKGPHVNAQHLAVVYAFYGIDPVEQPRYANDPNASAGARYESIYGLIVDELKARFVSQVSMALVLNAPDLETVASSPFLPFMRIAFNPETDRISVDFDTLIKTLSAVAPADVTQAAAYWNQVLPIVKALRVDLFDANSVETASQFIMAAEKAGLAESVEALFLDMLSITCVDQGSTTGTITGLPSNAIIYLGEGDKSISDGSNNTFVYAPEGGNVTIAASGPSSRLVMRDIDSGDVTLQRPGHGDDLIIVNNVTGKTVTITGYFSGASLATILFADDGVALSTGGVGDTLRAQALEYLNAPAHAGDTPGERAAQLSFYGFISLIDSGGSPGTLSGTTAEDVMFGSSGADIIYGQQGGDILFGWAGNDTLSGGDGDDTYIRGGAGDDTLDGGAGDDTYFYARGDGNDVIIEGTSGNFSTIDSLVLEGINPADVSLVRNGGDVTLMIGESAPGAGDGGSILLKDGFEDWFSQGVENVVFADGTIWTQVAIREMLIASAGTAGNDIILGSSASDLMVGRGGDDALNGGAGDDTYVYTRGDGDDVITEGTVGNFSSYDTLILHEVASADVQFVRDGNSVTLTIAESVVGAGDAGSIRLVDGLDGWFSRGVEQIVFDNGTVWTQADMRAALLVQAATAGDDLIHGFPGDDVIAGGHGDDIVLGGGGSDTYVYASGDGKDIIDNQTSSGPNKLVLHGIAVADVTVVRNAGNAIMLFGAGGIDGRITIKEQFGSGGKITTVEFDDGTVWTDQTILANAVASDGSIVTHYGTTGADDIAGTVENDVIDGRGGADILQGGNGNDTYHYGAGSGDDTIVEGSGSAGSGDRVKLAGLNASDVEFTRLGNDLFLKILSNGDTLKVKDQFNGDIGVEQITFADNTVWDRSQIGAASWIRGTAGDDTISGGGGDENIDGGAGNDTLSGGVGSDTYLFGVGSGNDTITEAWFNSGSDAVRLKNLLPADVQFGQDGNDLVILIISSGEQLRVTDQFNGSAAYGIEQVQFSDHSTWDRSQIVAASWMLGTSGDDIINGTGGDDKIDGGAGNDTLSGNSGSDSYVFGVGSGNDTINEAWHGGGTDVVKLRNLLPADVLFSQEGGDLVIRIISSGEQLRVANQLDISAPYGVEQVTFADNTTWNRSQIAEASWIRGTAGNDTMTGGGGVEKIDGGGGNDILAGRGGGDIYLYGIGSGNDTINEVWYDGGTDTVRLAGLLPADVRFNQVSSDLIIEIVSTGEQLKITNQLGGEGVEQLLFADNTTWNRSQIAEASWIRGTAGNDTITGGGGVEKIDGGGGNDTLAGRDGGDTYLYGIGSGNDTINEVWYDGGTDTVRLAGLLPGDVRFNQVSSDLIIEIVSTGEQLKITNQLGGEGVEQVVFSDNTSWSRAQIQSETWIRGTSGADTIVGGNNADQIDGRAGNDTLSGGAGNDTFAFRTNLGQDTITDFVAGQDVLRFEGGIFADAAASLAAATASGNHTIVTIDANNSVLLQNVALANLHVGDFQIV
ncbi:calcium-binding protein [Bradyrhizobium sp.]|uniref:beta strand repeat-containing protein n=1 Tax=Bradyrhizobium sp. TaxID=376 RepID=UPI0025BBF301|nr:calcium-binding protein [Bradyrhizobium sp.]